MGSCCSCPDTHSLPDDHHSKFKVINVDDDGNELGSGVMELTEAELILHTHKHDGVRWPYLCLRRYGYDSNLFSFESGRRCQTGQGIFAFRCARAEEMFNLLQDVMHSSSISVVEEAVPEPGHAPPDPDGLHTPTTPGYSVPAGNGIAGFLSLGEASSRPASRHPCDPSVGQEATHTLLGTDQVVHTYVNTSGVQEDRRPRPRSHTPLELRLSNPESSFAAPANPLAEVEPQVVLEAESVKFVLGPTPVQKQRQRGAGDREPGPGPGGAEAGARVGAEAGGTEAGAGVGAEAGGTEAGARVGAEAGGTEAGAGVGAEAGGTEAGAGVGAEAGGTEAGAGQRDREVDPGSGVRSGSLQPSSSNGYVTLATECDTGYDSDERTKDAPPPLLPPAQSSAKLHNGMNHVSTTVPASNPAPRRNRPARPTPEPSHNANNSAQRRAALLNYENLPSLPPVWETPKRCSAGEEEDDDEEEEEEEAYRRPKTRSLNGYRHHLHHRPHHHRQLQHPLLDPMHNYVNTENVTMPLSAKLDSARLARRDGGGGAAPTVFNFDFRGGAGGLGGPDPLRQLNYIELEMERGSDSSGTHTPKTPTTPLLATPLLALPPTPTRRTELYAVIDIERTAAMSSLQRALPRDDGTSRKTRHNSTDLPM